MPPETDPAASAVTFRGGKLVVELTDGRSLLVPLEWYPRLAHASETERRNWKLLGGGYAIEWPEIDEHIGVDGLIAGRKSGESTASLNRWLSHQPSQKSPNR
jgi:hypothetical protein